MMRNVCVQALILAGLAAAGPVFAGTPKHDPETCNQLRAEQAGFVQSGILADIQRGADWGKANLPPARIKDIENFFMLDEQLKFGCREATLTPESMRAGEEALKIEANPDADPNAPPVKPEGGADAPAKQPANPPTNLPTNPDAAAAPGADATAGEAAETQKPAIKPKVQRRAQPRAKQKAADDAFVPPAGAESTLQAPPAPDAPAVKAQ